VTAASKVFAAKAASEPMLLLLLLLLETVLLTTNCHVGLQLPRVASMLRRG